MQEKFKFESYPPIIPSNKKESEEEMRKKSEDLKKVVQERVKNALKGYFGGAR